MNKKEAAVLNAARRFVSSPSDANIERLKRVTIKLDQSTTIITNVIVGIVLIGACIAIGISSVTKV